MTSNLFGIHWITAKVMHEVYLAIVKRLASKSVWSTSFAVLRSSSVPKPSCLSISFFCNTVYCACLFPSKYLPLNSIVLKAMKFSILLDKFLSFSSTSHLYCLCHFFRDNVFKISFKKIKNGFALAYYRTCIKKSSSLGVIWIKNFSLKRNPTFM